MKKVIFTFVLLPAFLLAQGVLELQTSGTSQKLHTIHMFDQNNGWVYGENGTLLKTTNGGATWQNKSSDVTRLFQGISFVSPQTVFGFRDVEQENYEYQNILYRTFDGGASWDSVDIVDVGDNGWGLYAILDIVFFDNLNGYILEFVPPGRTDLVVTHDGGDTWTRTLEWGWRDGGGLLAYHFLNMNYGWVSYYTKSDNFPKDYQYETEKYGAGVWTEPNCYMQTTNIVLLDEDHLWMQQVDLADPDFLDFTITAYGISRSTDGGATWDCIPMSGHLSELQFTSANTGFYCKPNQILRSNDGGETWPDILFTLPTSPIVQFHALTQDKIWIVGNNGFIAKYTSLTAPVAHITPSIHYCRLNEQIELDGSSSSGGNLAYVWTVLDKPQDSSPLIVGPNQAVLEFTPDKTGWYRLRLQVSNALGSDDAEVNVFCGIRWRYETGGAIHASPAIDPIDGSIVVGSEDHQMRALNPDGSEKWVFDADSPIHQSAVIDVDRSVLFGTSAGSVIRLDSAGALVWRTEIGQEITGGPSLGSDGEIILGTVTGDLVTFNEAGVQISAFPAGSAIRTEPAVLADGSVIFGTDDGKITCLNPNREVAWAYMTGGPVQSSPCVSLSGKVFFGSCDDYLYALNPKGQFLWRFQTGGDVVSSPCLDPDGNIYMGSDDHKVYALDSLGNELWHYETGGPVQSSPLIDADGTVCFGSQDDDVYMLHSNGTLAGYYQTGGDVDSSPALGADSTVYVGCVNGKVYPVYASSNQLAESSWPKFKNNLQNTARSLFDPLMIPKADFGADPLSGECPLSVQFSDSSTGSITSWDWNFGDGANSSDQNPIHVYETTGTFSVRLIVTGPLGADTLTKADYILVREPVPAANFGADPVSGERPLTVQFSDSSTGVITSWQWDFGDGTTSTDQHPAHVYETADTFSVTLIVSNSTGADTLTREDYIRVTDGTGVEPVTGNLPTEFELFQNYPNPFNPVTNIQYHLKETCVVWMGVFNIQGKLVQVLENRIQQRGSYLIRWDASDYSSGIFILKIRMGANTRIHKMIKLD